MKKPPRARPKDKVTSDPSQEKLAEDGKGTPSAKSRGTPKKPDREESKSRARPKKADPVEIKTASKKVSSKPKGASGPYVQFTT